ncbi:MAG: dnaX [Candidatus Saccharibacteria bacterium]|nr:dnaX [Candidatus Saccharibacteria bacterium]
MSADRVRETNMSTALYRKYRSKSLDEIEGQSHITSVLRQSLEQGRVAHAYLLTGPRGVGKTSVARILAHEINHLPYDEDATHLDIIEIDAASNNGVEDVRDLREKVQLAPVSAEKKVYIIDEVHMLSKPAFNALLKTLEEPPAHVVFILATTDADKLPATIVSRTQQFGFRAITPADATKHLAMIAKKEHIKIDEKALELIALRGQGSFRDSIGLLDQLASLAEKKTGITHELVEQTLGLAPTTIIERLLDGYEQHDIELVVTTLDESESLGIQASTLAQQLIETVRATIATTPSLLPLLSQLIEVSKSSQPSIKLLTVLAAHTVPKPKTAALSASPSLILDAPIKALERKAMQKKPKDPVVKTSAPADATPSSLNTFDWDKLVDYVREHYVAISSVLVKCSYEVTPDGLTIYTVNNFYKKKLDDTRYRPLIAQSLEALGFSNIVINTVPTGSPLKDEQAAKVAAIMGGGEEVIIESDGKQ